MPSQEPEKPSAKPVQVKTFQQAHSEAVRLYFEDVRRMLNQPWVFGSYMPPSRTRWQKVVSKVAIRRNIVRERLALRLAPWLEPSDND